VSDVYLNAQIGYDNLVANIPAAVNKGSSIVSAPTPYISAYQFSGSQRIDVGNVSIGGDFTVEFFFILVGSWANGYSRTLMSFGTALNNIDGFGLEVFKNSSGRHLWFRQSYSGIRGIASGLALNQWYHVVVQRSGTQWSFALDGNLNNFNPEDPSRDLLTPRTMWIGYGVGSWVQYPEIKIADFNMMNAARYSAAFTPQYPLRSINIPSVGVGMPLKKSDVMTSWEGNHRVHGTVRLESSPASGRPVYLMEPNGMRVIAKTNANADGKYDFSHIKPGRYLVMGRDQKTHYHPDIVRVDSEPM